jgi:hypothetical protein
MFILGTGFRPPGNAVFPVRGGYVEVQSDGDVFILAGSESYSPYLDGISFYAG